jgi:hypothetical protein
MNNFILIYNDASRAFAVADCAGGRLLQTRSFETALHALAALNAPDDDPDKVSPEIFTGWREANKFWRAYYTPDNYKFNSALSLAQFHRRR